ncbi:hypothetical protein DNTS_006107 [Danionella cerebrum]|uniref:MICOS complex subunit MIC60 n=1 Tax=Danionella cerebrum TaxID=2873325 RepID=A0A553QMG5_9TELE|nr:hypothetical protein DNTS_006107 [Danionella translucida]
MRLERMRRTVIARQWVLELIYPLPRRLLLEVDRFYNVLLKSVEHFSSFSNTHYQKSQPCCASVGKGHIQQRGSVYVGKRRAIHYSTAADIPLVETLGKHQFHLKQKSAAGKIVAASLLTVTGGLGGTILYAKWDPKFRSTVEKSVPYSDQVFNMVLGQPPLPPAPKKQARDAVKALQISSLPETTKESKQPKAKLKMSEPAPKPQQTRLKSFWPSMKCPLYLHRAQVMKLHLLMRQQFQHLDKNCLRLSEELQESSPPEPALQERPAEEVTARLAEQDKAELDALAALMAGLEESLGSSAKVTLQAIGAQEAALTAIASHTGRLKEAMDSETPPDEKAAQALNEALSERTRAVDGAGEALLRAK